MLHNTLHSFVAIRQHNNDDKTCCQASLHAKSYRLGSVDILAVADVNSQGIASLVTD